MSSSRIGTINHLGLSVTEKARSFKFYHFLLVDLLGFKQGQDTPYFTAFLHPTGGAEIIISPARSNVEHDRYNPGYHHLALNVDSPEQVDQIHAKLVQFYAENQSELGAKAKILDQPALYPQYTDGYYAVFFADPDGMKLEIVYMPGGH
ncbi:hypothetical protein DFQ27_006218 [Actinomortierella ambigua]|uniref:VOC domain-containing protein n=1 Tax=Actinomortierella ambigua TaxID=1343610 RepID=A0A9P6PZZ7_9FUNG|nr:hypothetical protein DFQ26_000986 [Actinomortierella ambigua]KAG0255505.1 hypothetical protein DFQ27_006218 [Actinomortierella ambigua]